MLSAVRKTSMVLFLSGLGLLVILLAGKFQPQQSLPGQDYGQVYDQSVPKPTRIRIPAIKVDANMVELGLNKNGSLQVPSDPKTVGWYVGGPRPGGVGPAVMVGHLDSVHGPEIFWNLKNLQIGDTIQVAREDGSTVTFRVTDKQNYSQNNFPTDKVYGPINYPGLRLITCSGTYSRLAGHYSQNLVVYASLVK